MTITPSEAIAILRKEHKPYVPRVVEILEDGIWRDPTFEDQIESETWCDGCNRASKSCTIATILALVEENTDES